MLIGLIFAVQAGEDQGEMSQQIGIEAVASLMVVTPSSD
jgi:hypothetical protein